MSKKVTVFFLAAFLFGLCSAGVTLAFTVTVSISNPSSGSEYQEGTPIFLAGEGVVVESDFRLQEDDLKWYANGQFIGKGSLISWNPVGGAYNVSLIGEIEGVGAVDEIDITVISSFHPSQPLQSGDAASYNLITNTLYIPFRAGGVAYWVNMAVTSFATPLTFVLTGIGAAEFSPTASYAYFNLFANTVWVPVFMDEGVSYYMSLKLTNSEAPLTFQLTGFGLNH
jgi:hypothetical protein